MTDNEEENIHCLYCGNQIEIIEGWHFSGAWDIIKGKCKKHGYLEIEVECYNACVEDILNEDKITDSETGTILDQ